MKLSVLSLLYPFRGIAEWFKPIRENASEEILLKDGLFVYIGVITSFFTMLYAIISFIIEFKIGVVFQIICFIILYVNLFDYKKNKNFRKSSNIYIANCLVLSILVCSLFTGGLFSLVAPWLALISVTGILLLGFCADTIIWFVICTMIALAYGVMALMDITPVPQYNTAYTDIFYTICVAGLVMILFFLVIVFDVNRNIALKKLLDQNEELAAAKKKAEEATAAKSIFLAHMSHEIRTPMNAIIGYSELALKTELSVKQRDYVQKIDYSSRNLLGILNDILDVSKIEAGKIDIEHIPFNLEEVFMEVSNILAIRASKKGLEYIHHIDKEVPYKLIGDPQRIRQILLNLTGNALKFTERGQISLIATLDKTSNDCCMISFSVKDTGIGISDENLGKLFKAFSQVDESDSRVHGGTGLGLNISKNLAEMMGGTLTVKSEVGKGSEFIFTIRLEKQTSSSERLLAIPTEVLNYRILVVDDNELARFLIEEQLNEMGFRVTSVSGGEEAIHALRSEKSDPYGIVIMDWLMPEIDGIETTKRIQNDPAIVSIPLVLMISAHMKEDIIERAEHIGIKTFVVKPVNPSVLYDAIVETVSSAYDGKKVASIINATDSTRSLKFDSQRVLLCEDNEMNKQIAYELLTGEGFKVTTAENGKAAIMLIEKQAFDLVLMDLQMPIMGGIEATKLIRSGKFQSNVPIIAMTAHANIGMQTICLEAGMNDYVSKPISPERLFEVIRL